MAKAPAKKATTVAKKATVAANKDREESCEILREIMRFSEDDQARAIAAIGLAQLSLSPIH